MRNASVRTLVRLVEEGADIHFLTADLGFKVLDPFRQAHPGRLTNVGVAEANLVSIAAGMALAGKIPVCYSMMPFLLMRALEQIRMDVLEPGLRVVLVGVGAGLVYGHEGTSHHAIEDLAIARSMPGLRVIAPGDAYEAEAAIRLATSADGPTLIRLGANDDPNVHRAPLDSIECPLVVCEGDQEILLLATGHILASARLAATLLKNQGVSIRVASVPVLKPMDQHAMTRLCRPASLIFTAEEHSTVGGLGTAVSEILLEIGSDARLIKIGLPDSYCQNHGSAAWLRNFYEIDAAGIAKKISEQLKKNAVESICFSGKRAIEKS